jgi:hypothetical protein
LSNLINYLILVGFPLKLAGFSLYLEGILLSPGFHFSFTVSFLGRGSSSNRCSPSWGDSYTFLYPWQVSSIARVLFS